MTLSPVPSPLGRGVAEGRGEGVAEGGKQVTTPTATELEEKRNRLRRWISPEYPEAATQGVNHLAVFAKDLEVTAQFYS